MSEEKPETTLPAPEVTPPVEEPKKEKGEQPKQESSGNSKKTVSYTYWVDEKNKSRELPEEHRPKKIDPASVAQNTY